MFLLLSFDDDFFHVFFFFWLFFSIVEKCTPVFPFKVFLLCHLIIAYLSWCVFSKVSSSFPFLAALTTRTTAINIKLRATRQNPFVSNVHSSSVSFVELIRAPWPDWNIFYSKIWNIVSYLVCWSDLSWPVWVFPGKPEKPEQVFL